MKWLALRIGGQKWGAYQVSPNSKHLLNEHGERLVGKCDYDKCRVYVSREGSNDVVEERLLHELEHALLFVSGAEKVYGGSPAKEERLVSAVTPLRHLLLKDLGFRFPKGTAA